jgi:hypothetical protein
MVQHVFFRALLSAASGGFFFELAEDEVDWLVIWRGFTMVLLGRLGLGVLSLSTDLSCPLRLLEQIYEILGPRIATLFAASLRKHSTSLYR